MNTLLEAIYVNYGEFGRISKNIDCDNKTGMSELSNERLFGGFVHKYSTALKNIGGQFIYLITFVKIFLADFLIRQYSPNPGPLSFFSDSAKAVISSKFALIN